MADDTTVTRRDVLGGLTATAGVAALAGCTTTPEFDVNTVVSESETVSLGSLQWESVWTITRIGSDSVDMDIEVVYPETSVDHTRLSVPYNRLQTTQTEEINYMMFRAAGDRVRVVGDHHIDQRDIEYARSQYTD